MRRTTVLVIVLMSAGLIAAVYLLRIGEVKVTGARTLSARTVVEASGLRPGDRILWERLSVAERRVEQLPAVADVVAERSLPGTVILRIQEREPVVRLDTAPKLGVDADGVVFELGDREVKAVLTGWEGRARPGRRVDRASSIVLRAYEEFPPVLRIWARRLTVGPTFTLRLLGGPDIYFGGLRDLDVKAQVAARIIEVETGTRLEYVDVRSPRVPVARPAGASPAPSGSPSPSPAALTAP